MKKLMTMVLAWLLRPVLDKFNRDAVIILDKLDTLAVYHEELDARLIADFNAVWAEFNELHKDSERLQGHINERLQTLVSCNSHTSKDSKGDQKAGLDGIDDRLDGIVGKLNTLYEKLDSVASDVDDIDTSGIERAVESAIGDIDMSEISIDTSDIDYSVEQARDSAESAYSVAKELRMISEEILELVTAAAPVEPELEPQPEQPEHDALQGFALGEFAICQAVIIGPKLLICNGDSVIAEHYLPDTTAEGIKAFAVKTLAPVLDDLAVTRPWMRSYHAAVAADAVRA